MKPGSSLLIIALILLGLSAVGCGGGGGGGSTAHPPSISGLYLYPNSVLQSSGTGTVTFGFDFTDAGGDLSSMTVTVYDNSGTVLVTETAPLQDAAGITAAQIYGYLTADTSVAGTFTIEFRLADSRGAISNALSATFTVLAPLSITVTPADPVVNNGATQQFTATAAYADNSMLDVTNQATWTSSDTNVATIAAAGLATAKTAGTSTITATLDGMSGSTTLKVVAAFAPATNYPASIPSYNLWGLGNTAIGDLNGDGRNDVAVLEETYSGPHVFLYYQNTDHILGSPQVITTDLNLKGIAIADVNNDGLADLVVSGNLATATSGPLGRIYVYKQDAATHELGAPQQYVVSTDNVAGLAVADLNNDGLRDIVSSGTGTGNNGVVSFLFQAANGTLGSEVTYTSVPVSVGGELHVADMNNDGLNDVVLQSGLLQLAVIKQVSAGTFSTSPDYYAVQTSYVGYFSSFALGDLNGDGRTDIAVADPGNFGYLNIFFQNAGGQLSGPTLRTIGFSVQDEVDIADMDGDGLNDIILLSYGNTVQILYQAADHSFPGVLTYYLQTNSSGGTSVRQALSVGDVTGDGLPDIVASWQNDIYVMPRLP